MVGSAVVRLLGERAELVTASRGELDLRDDARVRQFWVTNEWMRWLMLPRWLVELRPTEAIPIRF